MKNCFLNTQESKNLYYILTLLYIFDYATNVKVI
jgi:hypothetical protein